MAYHSAWGGWSESDWYDDRTEITCECGAVYPRHSRKVNASSVNGIANGCTACKPDRQEREIAKAATRCRLKLARHIATQRARTRRVIYRDVAIRYLQRFGGQTFAVQTDVDACEIYLENAKGLIIGKVSYLDLYPKGLDDVVVDDIPF